MTLSKPNPINIFEKLIFYHDENSTIYIYIIYIYNIYIIYIYIYFKVFQTKETTDNNQISCFLCLKNCEVL